MVWRDGWQRRDKRVYWRAVLLSFALLVFFFGVHLTLRAEDGGSGAYPHLDSAFQAGLKFYREKKFSEAVTAFEKAREFDGDNVAILTNLALAYYQSGQKDWAFGYLRRSLSLNPFFSLAKESFDYMSANNPPREPPHEILLVETLRIKVLPLLPTPLVSILAAIFVLFFGWRLIPLPSRFSIGTLVLGFLCVSSLSLLAFKVYTSMQVRGTVLGSEKVQLLSAPEESAPMIINFDPGLEVVVTGEKGTWFHIHFPGGPSGWVKSSELLLER